MGQKVNPIGLRLGVNRTWDSRWYADGAEYVKLLHEDFAIREFLEKRLRCGLKACKHKNLFKWLVIDHRRNGPNYPILTQGFGTLFQCAQCVHVIFGAFD